MLLCQGGQALAGATVGGHLGAQVADAFLRRPHIGHDDGLDIAVDDVVAVEPHRRQAQALAINLRHRAIGAGGGAADIRPVRPHAGITEQLALEERRGHNVHIRQM